MSTARSRVAAAARGRRAPAAPAAPAAPLLSFVLRARVVASIGNVQYDALRDSLARLLSAHALQLGGAWAPEPSLVIHRAGGEVDAADRRAVALWAATRREFVDYRVGPLLTAYAPE